MRWVPPRSAWTVGLGTTLAFGGWGALPWIIGAIVEGVGFRNDAAAFLGTVELTLMGLCMLVIAPRVPRMNRARAIAFALPVMVAAQITSAFLHSYSAFLVVRALSGIAFGLVLAVATAEGADNPEPDRAFAAAAVIAMCFGIIKTPLLGYAKELFGYRGLFLALAFYYLLVGVPFFAFLMVAPKAQSRALTPAPKAPISVFAVVGVLIVMAMYSVATGGVYAFVERVANHVGISASGLGRGFSATSLVATLGGAAAGRLGLRWGRGIPTLGGFIVLGLLSIWLMSTATPWGFWLCYVPWAVAYWFAYPYIMGLSVLVDPLGRLATVTSAVLILTGAVGASLAGIFTQHAGLSSFGWAACVLCFLGALAAGLVIRKKLPLPPFAASPASLSPID